MRCGKEHGKSRVSVKTRRNPRECAVAKAAMPSTGTAIAASQPARMRCGKVAYSGGKDSDCISRNPRECAVAKIAQYRQHTQ